MSRNLKRRHLNAPQRSDAIRKLRALPQWRVISNREIAKQIGVDEATVRRAQDTAGSRGLSAASAVDATRAPHTITVKRGEQEYRMRVERKPAPEPPASARARRPAPFSPGGVMLRMRNDGASLKGADLATLIAEWIMARIDVSLVIGAKPDVMTALGGAVAARSSISAWLRSNVLDSQRAGLVKETIAAMINHGERNRLIEEIAADRAKPAPVYRERI